MLIGRYQAPDFQAHSDFLFPLYFKVEKRIGKKIYYGKNKYNTSNNLKVYLLYIIQIFANSVQINYYKFTFIVNIFPVAVT